MKLKKTNLKCVNADRIGLYCLVLNDIHKGCLKGECPFYKTEETFKRTEANARRRCDDLGIVFQTRAEIIDSMNRIAQIQKERYEKSKRG